MGENISFNLDDLDKKILATYFKLSDFLPKIARDLIVSGEQYTSE